MEVKILGLAWGVGNRHAVACPVIGTLRADADLRSLVCREAWLDQAAPGGAGLAVQPARLIDEDAQTRGGKLSLNQYFWTNTGRPINKWVHYLPVYERWLAAFRNRCVVFLEIGAGQGGSSQMWKHHLGAAARIVSIDVREECREFGDEQVAVRIGDQSDPEFLQSLIDEFGAPDIVLDDGSHQMDHVNATFDYLYPRMPRDAIYMVEDTHTAYWPAWGGGLGSESTIIERSKKLIDGLHADNPHNGAQAKPPIPVNPIARLTRGIHFYDGMIVLEKGPPVARVDRSIPFIPDQTIW